MKTKDFALHVKDVEEDGTFTGYGSIFGNIDSYGESVEPGAFAKSLARHAKEKTRPLMLWQHNTDSPIGVWEDLVEDSKGLRGVGRLLKGVRLADEAHIMLKAGALQGLSIGYREIRVEPDGNNRKLKELDLLEISVVSFPANRRARIDSVKSERAEEFARRLRDGDPPSIKEFEDVLGDLGIPKALRAGIASHGYVKAIRSESGAKSATPDLSGLRAAVEAFLPQT